MYWLCSEIEILKENIKKLEAALKSQEEKGDPIGIAHRKCFPDFMKNCVINVLSGTDCERTRFVEDWRDPKPYKQYIIGYVPAVFNDVPAVIAIDKSDGCLKRAHNMAGLSWYEQYNKLSEISRHYNNAPIAFSQTGHEVIKEELKERGVNCFAINTQDDHLKSLVIHMENLVGCGEFHVLDDGSEVNNEIIAQFNDYARIEKNGQLTFGGITKLDNNYVICALIACGALKVK